MGYLPLRSGVAHHFNLKQSNIHRLLPSL